MNTGFCLQSLWDNFIPFIYTISPELQGIYLFPRTAEGL